MDNSPDLIQVFEETTKNLIQSGQLPECSWLPWEFMKPKVSDWGDLCTFTVLRTSHKAKKLGIENDPQHWCQQILSSLPPNNSIEKIYAENGIINIKLVKNPENLQEKPTNSLQFEPIGHILSCFSEKFGTPRQSLYSKYSRGIVMLKNCINIDCFEGIEEYSHVWLIFVFHKSSHSKFKTKIKPPRLNGEKKGIFATRAPHRYNPIGLSLVKLEKVEERKIWVSGIDLINETPILDIKPYHPVDSLSQFHCPEYITRPIFIYKVEFHPHAVHKIESIKKQFTLQFYTNEEDWQEIIKEILSQDPSTVHTKMKHSV